MTRNQVPSPITVADVMTALGMSGPPVASDDSAPTSTSSTIDRYSVVSVTDVMAALGCFMPGFDKQEMKAVAWTAGTLVGRKWRDQLRHGPVQRYRAKTYMPGYHNKSVYPLSWWGEIETIVRGVLRTRRINRAKALGAIR